VDISEPSGKSPSSGRFDAEIARQQILEYLIMSDVRPS
jgi:hypothetical protein